MTDEEKKKAEEEAKKAAEEEAKKAAAEAVKTTEPFATFPDAESFKRRVEREARALLKEAGIVETDPAKLKVIVDGYAKQQADAAAAEEAKKSEIQRAAEAKAKAEADAIAAMSAAESAKMQAHLYKTFAEQGVKNFDYAFYAVTAKLAGLKDGEELDEVEFIKGMLKDPTQAAALGIAASAQVQGATTTQQGAKPETEQKPAGAGAGTGKPADAFSKSPEEFRRETQAKYGFST